MARETRAHCRAKPHSKKLNAPNVSRQTTSMGPVQLGMSSMWSRGTPTLSRAAIIVRPKRSSVRRCEREPP
jgi:hypothetical protein